MKLTFMAAIGFLASTFVFTVPAASSQMCDLVSRDIGINNMTGGDLFYKGTESWAAVSGQSPLSFTGQNLKLVYVFENVKCTTEDCGSHGYLGIRTLKAAPATGRGSSVVLLSHGSFSSFNDEVNFSSYQEFHSENSNQISRIRDKWHLRYSKDGDVSYTYYPHSKKLSLLYPDDETGFRHSRIYRFEFNPETGKTCIDFEVFWQPQFEALSLAITELERGAGQNDHAATSLRLTRTGR